MKTTKLSLALAGLMIASSIIVSSCKKKDNTTTTTDNDTSAASDHATAENTASDVDNMAAEASEQGSFSSYRLGSGQQETVSAISCATMTFDTANRKVIATFNITSTCLDGRTRSGSLTFDYSASPSGAAHYRNPGFNCTVTSQNYMVDGNAVSINKNIINTTASTFNSATTNMTWSITATISIVKANSGGTISYNCTRIKTLLNTSDVNVYHGQATHITWSLAKVGLMGSANGTTAAGNTFSANITSQLVRDLSCAPDANRPGRHPFIQGDIDFTPGTKATRHIDYGTGTCDLDATVTINGNSYPITLP